MMSDHNQNELHLVDQVAIEVAYCRHVNLTAHETARRVIQLIRPDVDKLVNAFLAWPLPDSVCSDLCATKQGPGRVGTNLLTADEARQMFDYVFQRAEISVPDGKEKGLGSEVIIPCSSSTRIRQNWLHWLSAKADRNVKKWGVQDFDTLGLAVAEEAGELAQAILKARQERGELGRISAEALDLGALCLQVLVTMEADYGVENILKGLLSENGGEHLAAQDNQKPSSDDGSGSPQTLPVDRRDKGSGAA